MIGDPGHGAAGTVLVAGGTGFVGTRLVRELSARGRDVRVMTRSPERYDGPGTAVRGDVTDSASLEEALRGCTTAYYLVHSIDAEDFAERDAAGARAFGAAAATAGLDRIVYLGGLGNDDDALSEHLRSRREVERLLGASGVPVTVLRAGIIVGHGSLSWEITRQLVEHLPAMVTPRWVRTRTQPIAIDDVVRYLVGVLDHPLASGETFEIGGAEVLAYREMLSRVAAIEGRRLPIVPVPFLTPRLSSRWLAFVTDVDPRAGRNLIDSMVNEVVVTDHAIRRIVPGEPLGYDAAVRAALAERQRGGRPGTREPTPVRRRRRAVVAGTTLCGAGLLGASLSRPPGSRSFYLATTAVAGVWVAGAVAAGPTVLGTPPRPSGRTRSSALTSVPGSVATGATVFGAFYAAALVARRVPFLDRALTRVLSFAEVGDARAVLLTTVANGVAEELFFRGALYTAAGERSPVLVSTVAYAGVTTATRNPALVVAAGVMGGLFGWQRRSSGGVRAPLITHLTWSALVLRYLPPVFCERRDRAATSR